MGVADFVILAVIAVCVYFAWRTWRKSGSCSCGSGSGCCGDCTACRGKANCDKKK